MQQSITNWIVPSITSALTHSVSISFCRVGAADYRGADTTLLYCLYRAIGPLGRVFDHWTRFEHGGRRLWIVQFPGLRRGHLFLIPGAQIGRHALMPPYVCVCLLSEMRSDPRSEILLVVQQTPFKLVMRTPQQTRERTEEEKEENKMAARTPTTTKAERSVVEN